MKFPIIPKSSIKKINTLQDEKEINTNLQTDDQLENQRLNETKMKSIATCKSPGMKYRW